MGEMLEMGVSVVVVPAEAYIPVQHWMWHVCVADMCREPPIQQGGESHT